MAKVVFREERCKGCSLCVAACPKKIIRISDRLNNSGFSPAEVTDERECIACGFCARMCPDCVISVFK